MNDDEREELIKELSKEYNIKKKKPQDGNSKLIGMMVISWILIIINILVTAYIIYKVI